MPARLKLLLLAAAITLPSSHAAYALQPLDAKDGDRIEASISLKEPTRIRLEKGPITDVFGNIYQSSCAQLSPTGTTGSNAGGAPPINPLGEIVLECDRDKGEVYVRPVGPGAKPINLFVSSGEATYTLLLMRVDMPADTIVIRDKTVKRGPVPDSPSLANLTGRSPVHIRNLKTMLIAMATDRVSPEIRIEEVGRPVALWAEVRFSLMRTYEGRGLVGEKYLLTNVSDRPMVLAEQEFDREGADVLAVSVETMNLRPGESTNVYVIRGGS